MDVERSMRPVPLTIRVLHVIRLIAVFFGKFLFRLYYGTDGEKIPPIKEDLLRQPAVEIARRIRTKEISSVEVLETFIRRIKDVNPALNCFIEDRFEEALREARGVDDLVGGGSMSELQMEAEKPFLGVPFTTKDCIAVKGLHHTAGVVLRKDVIAAEDAVPIRLLRDSGAIVIGLTNVPELCMWWETHNHIHGRTNNAYNTTRIVGGSSGGEGCLQSVAGSAFGVGSDIGGSIRMPSFFNGVFGHKPSRYIVSNVGAFPEPKADLHKLFLGCGPMVRHAVDLKPLLKIMAGANASKLNLDTPLDLSKIKVFYQYQVNAPLTDPVDDDIVAAMRNVVEHFNALEIDTEELHVERLDRALPMWMALMKDDESFAHKIMARDGICDILMELVKNAFGYSDNTLIGLMTALTDSNDIKIGDAKYNHYRGIRDELEKYFKALLKDNGVFLLPTHPTPAPYHHEPLLRPLNFVYTALVNTLGLPATHVPLGLGAAGLPVGLQVVADHDNDRLCLAVAEELGRAFGGWREPQRAA